MTEEICPTCGCEIVEGSYDKKGIKYCCEPCATSTQCKCGCCKIVEEQEQ